MEDLLALVVFSFVNVVTPGPNNALLWASGVQFGFQATIPHVIGTSIGIGTMAAAVASGLGLVVTRIPEIELGLKVIGSIYLLYLAYRIAVSRVAGQAVVARPLSVIQGAGMQFLNPKGWIFALAAITTFRPDGFSPLVGNALVVLTMAIVVVPGSSIWAAGGTALNRLIASDATRRRVNLGLAAVLALTVAYLWI